MVLLHKCGLLANRSLWTSREADKTLIDMLLSPHSGTHMHQVYYPAEITAGISDLVMVVFVRVCVCADGVITRGVAAPQLPPGPWR